MAILDPVLKVHQSMRRQNCVNPNGAIKMPSKVSFHIVFHIFTN